MTCEIWHGDSIDLIEKLPEPINCLILDPPYGVNFESRRAETGAGKHWVAPVANDLTIEQAKLLFADVMAKLRPKTATNCEAYVFTRWDVVGEWIELVNKYVLDFDYKMLLVWDKGIPGMGDIDANWGCGHELILYLKKGRRNIPYRRSGIIAVDKVPNMKHVHPTEKPVSLIETLLEMSTDVGDLVVDPFAGSGSSIVAAQNMDRQGIGIELEQRYVDAARRRLEQQGLPLGLPIT